MKKLFFEEIEIGKTYESKDRIITENDIQRFADLSGDYNPLHMDEEFAKKNMFGKRIAHGLLGLSIASGLETPEPPCHIMAFVDVQWQFKRPIFIGDVIHLETKVTEKKESRFPDRGNIFVARKLLNQDGKVTQEGTFNLLIQKKSSV